MSDELVQLNTDRSAAKVMMVGLLALALFGSWSVVRAYIGSAMAEYLSSEEGGLATTRRAVSLAPRDPFTHWTLGMIIQRKLPADQLAIALNELEMAVSLSPNDYRFWMDLGSALEHAGQVERGEKALRRSVELAPAYAYPRWYLGNLLLRNGRYDDAFGELRRASEADPVFQPQLFNAAWAVYSDDVESLKTAVGSTPQARAGFAQYLIGFQRFEDGILLWKSLSENEKRGNREVGQAMVKGLVDAKRYHEAVEISNDLAPSVVHSAPGRFVDGNFESGFGYHEGSIFGWKVTSSQQAQIGIDPAQGYRSGRSLRILFQVRSKLDSVDVSQLVPVVPDSQYDLEYAVKTQKVESADLPVVAIFDELDGKVLATSEAAPPGTNDWKPASVSFKSGPQTKAVTMRILRSSCAQDVSCPIYGTVWYDNFNLKRRD